MRNLLSSVCLLLTMAPCAFGDAFVRTQAMKASTICEIFVERGQVRVAFEIGISDLEGFQNLLPDEILGKLGLPVTPLAQRYRTFIEEDFVLRADGERLVPSIGDFEARDRVQRDDVTGEPLPPGDEPERVIFVELNYPLDGNPGTLEIVPKSPRGIGFMTYHLGLAVMEFRYLPGPVTLTLDWADPWYSQFANRNLQRTYRYPISVFLYAEPFEVRVEVIARPSDLQQWTDLGLEGRETIPVEMQDELLKKAGEFLGQHAALTVDGEAMSPELTRLNFLQRSLKASSIIDPPRELDLHSAMLGAIFVQPVPTLPKRAEVTWDLFSPKLATVSAAAADEAGPLPATLTPEDKVLVWKNFLTKPTIPALLEVRATPPGRSPLGPLLLYLGAGAAGLLAVVLGVRRRVVPAGAACLLTVVFVLTGLWRASSTPQPEQTDYEGVTTALLKNVYHAFDFRGEEKIYDTLAHSVSGELLQDIYLEVRRSLERSNAGGAEVKVQEVEVLALEPLGEGRFRCTWTAGGSVGHWGHLHTRKNQYVAEIGLSTEDGSWKLSELELSSEERVQ